MSQQSCQRTGIIFKQHINNITSSEETAKSVSGQIGQQSWHEAKALLKKLEKDPTFNSDPNADQVEEKAKYPTSHHLSLIASVDKINGLTLGVLMSMLQWDGLCDPKSTVSEDMKSKTVNYREVARETFIFTATQQNPWNTKTFKNWQHEIQKVLLQVLSTCASDISQDKGMKDLFDVHKDSQDGGRPDLSGNTNVAALAICHPILLDSMFKLPADIDLRLDNLIKEK